MRDRRRVIHLTELSLCFRLFMPHFVETRCGVTHIGKLLGNHYPESLVASFQPIGTILGNFLAFARFRDEQSCCDPRLP